MDYDAKRSIPVIEPADHRNSNRDIAEAERQSSEATGDREGERQEGPPSALNKLRSNSTTGDCTKHVAASLLSGKISNKSDGKIAEFSHSFFTMRTRTIKHSTTAIGNGQTPRRAMRRTIALWEQVSSRSARNDSPADLRPA